MVVYLSKEIYHCKFINLDKEQLNKIHLYIFQIQKKEAGASFRVMNFSGKAYHGVFADITTEEKENIHFYVLERQKEGLKEKKRR